MGISLSVNKTIYSPNEDIIVSYDMKNEEYTAGSCWIGLIPHNITSQDERENDCHDVDYFHVDDNKQGQGQLKTSQIGKYTIKCFANDNGGRYLGCIDHEITISNVIINNDDEKKMDVIPNNINNELQQMKIKPTTISDNIFKLAKQTYKQQGKPVVIDTNHILKDVKQNAANYRNAALPLTLGQDKPFNEWNEQQFKQEFSVKLGIPIECIHILSVRAGSCIIDLKLDSHSSGKKLLIPIEAIADKISNEKAKKALVEFGIFAMEFGLPTAGFNATQKRVIMNPKFNCEYTEVKHDRDYKDLRRKPAAYWEGPTPYDYCGAAQEKDGKSRGNEPYYCPRGWKRFGIQFSEQGYDFNNKYDNWPVAYHGTNFDVHMLITLTGLRCSNKIACHGSGVYFSPSIKYVSHPRYCRPIKLDLNKAKQKEWTSTHNELFKKYDGKWIQCAFQCRLRPGSYEKLPETMGLGHDGKFDNIDKREIEWLIRGKNGEILEDDKVIIYGLMIKASNTRPKGYNTMCPIQFDLKQNRVYDNSMCIEIEVLQDDHDTKASKTFSKKLVTRFGCFAAEFNDWNIGVSHTETRFMLNPKWSCVYGHGSGAVYWSGACKDGKSRGNEPYYCPVGWERFSFQYSSEILDFDDKYDNWPIAYIGAGTEDAMKIIFNGLKAAQTGCKIGAGVLLSPSIKYASHPNLAKPFYLDLDKKYQTKWHKGNYRQDMRMYDKRYVQCVFQCRVKPGCYTKHASMLNNNDKNIPQDEILWHVAGDVGESIGDERILVYGIMFKAK